MTHKTLHEQVLDIVRSHGPIGPKQIADLLEADYHAVQQALLVGKKRRELAQPSYGLYTIAPDLHEDVEGDDVAEFRIEEGEVVRRVSGRLGLPFARSRGDLEVVWVHVQSDSMEPLLKRGTLVPICMTQAGDPTPPGVYLVRYNNHIEIARLRQLPGDFWGLSWDNPMYGSIELANQPQSALIVLGRLCA